MVFDAVLVVERVVDTEREGATLRLVLTVRVVVRVIEKEGR